MIQLSELYMEKKEYVLICLPRFFSNKVVVNVLSLLKYVDETLDERAYEL